MASLRKTYFLAPSWKLQPKDVVLGSVVADLKAPQRLLSTTSATTRVSTEILPPIEQRQCSGVAKRSRQWSVGLFATFLRFITLGGEVSYGSNSTLVVEYSCDLMETRRFTPSSEYVAELSRDPGVRDYLKMGGLGTRASMITGVKTAYNITIATTEEKGQEMSAEVGMNISMTPATVGPKASYTSKICSKHTLTMPEPVVFAIQVEKIRLNRKGKLVSTEFVRGAMLADNENLTDEYMIERAGDDLDEEEVDDFGVSRLSGADDETEEECWIIAPLDATEQP